MLACRDTAISDGDRAIVGIEPLKELPVHKSLLSPGMRQKCVLRYLTAWFETRNTLQVEELNGFQRIPDVPI